MHPRCFKCGTYSKGGEFDTKLRIWSTGQLIPLPNWNRDQHLYMCKECQTIGTKSPDSWIKTDPRFYRAKRPHAKNEAFLEYRKQYMDRYDPEFRQKLRFKPEIYKGKRSGREYTIAFVNKNNIERFLPQLEHLGLVEEEAQSEDYNRVISAATSAATAIVIAEPNDNPDMIAAYNQIKTRENVNHKTFKDYTWINMYLPEKTPTNTKHTMGLPQIPIGNKWMQTMEEYRGDGLPGALLDYEQRAYPINGIYCEMTTTNPTMRNLAMKEQDFMYNTLRQKRENLYDQGPHDKCNWLARALPAMPDSYYPLLPTSPELYAIP